MKLAMKEINEVEDLLTTQAGPEKKERAA